MAIQSLASGANDSRGSARTFFDRVVATVGTSEHLAQARARVSTFFVGFLWLQIPIIALVARSNRSDARAILAAVAWMGAASLAATIAYRRDAGSLETRLLVAAAMTMAPALLVYVGRGPWQIDWHMYFFVVFAMLAAYVDFRPVALAAALTALHHFLLNAIFPGAVFPEPGLGRVVLHAVIVALECGALFWMIHQTHLLVARSQRSLAVAEGALRERTDAQEALQHVVAHDNLTGLPNRTEFYARVAAALERLRLRGSGTVAVIFMDCDRLTIVNDTLGHACGDRLLIEFTSRLIECMKSTDVLARLGGDEFAILVDRESDRAFVAIDLAREIVGAFASPFEIDAHRISFGASVGIAQADPQDGTQTPASLLRDADLAMHRAKALGGRRYEYFSRELARTTARHRTLLTDLPHALERRELRVVYQPIVALETRKSVGCEALLRWNHAELGPISPTEFVPIAEEMGLVVAIGEFVLREACASAVEWLAVAGTGAHFAVSVNVSVKQLISENFVETVEDILRTSHLSARHLNLEITESLLMTSSGPVTPVLDELRGMGVDVHLDDFGTGYSSLAYLHEFPVQTLKIDRSFVGGQDGADVAHPEIVRTILALAKHFGLGVTAEGVESEPQARRLRELGCQTAQGYLFSPPLEAAALTAYLRAERVAV